MDVEKIRKLIALMERRGLSRLVLTEDGVTVRLETGASLVTAVPVPVPAEALAAITPVALATTAPAGQPAAPAAEEPAPEPEPEGIPLLSPTTGTFYRSPAPGEASFVEVGDIVEVGQTVGIIMAMKVMSEVPAEVAGEIVAIPAEDSELVQAGTPLIVVRPES